MANEREQMQTKCVVECEPPWYIRCSNGSCGAVCDGVIHCPDGEDELNCCE